MRPCSQCGHQLVDQATFCPNCGASAPGATTPVDPWLAVASLIGGVILGIVGGVLAFLVVVSLAQAARGSHVPPMFVVVLGFVALAALGVFAFRAFRKSLFAISFVVTALVIGLGGLALCGWFVTAW